jgi:hypothetical protein
MSRGALRATVLLSACAAARLSAQPRGADHPGTT